MSQADFEISNLTYNATVHNLEVIGEAATQIPDDIKALHPDIPWRMVVAYLGIDNDIL
jgi:uncharacterized protein with HEPN domain